MYPKLRKSTLSSEGALKISQFIKIPLLLEQNEMLMLLTFLKEEFPGIMFYNTHGVIKNDEGILTPLEFVSIYSEYITLLQNGKTPNLPTFHGAFSSALSITSDIFYEIEIEGHSRIIKAKYPPIQLQPHQIVYSKDSGAIYSMAYSAESVTFGIQLSYPNFYQDPHTHEILDVDEHSLFPNTALFKKIRRWIREYTLPIPFMVDGKKMNMPIRLGKACFPWINKHPQLLQQNLYVYS